MKTKKIMLFIPVFLLASGLGLPWIQAQENKPYVAPKEHFSVWFPTNPTATQSTEKTALGAPGKNIYNSEDRGIFTVEYSILPLIQASLEDPKNIYDTAVKGFLTETGANQISLTDVTVQGNAAKQLTYKTVDGTTGGARFIKAGREFYVVSATTPYASWIRSFLASFKIL